MANSTILEHELSELRLLVERQSGVLLDCPNSVLASHIVEYLEDQQLDSAAALLDRLRCAQPDPDTLPGFLDGLLNANTGFFRYPGAMNALTRHVLPQLYARKTGDGSCSLRIWSAGCATGEEAYSIAMAISNPAPVGETMFIPGNGNGGRPKPIAPMPKNCSVHIVGSDLLPSAIRVAERGVYPQSALAGLPTATIRACFSKMGSAGGNAATERAAQFKADNNPANGLDDREAEKDGRPEPSSTLINAVSHLLVKPRLRSLVTFNVMNLIRPVYIGRFDCIFCMDVLPHLSRTQRTSLLERLHLYLEPGGYLFLSQTEKLSAPNLNFRPETFDGYTFHRKPLAASAAYGR